MKPSLLKLALVTSGAVLFNLIFWNEKLAINALLFDAFILTGLYCLFPDLLKKAGVKGLIVAHLISLATLIIHNTILSKIAFTSTFLLLVVFSQYQHQSVLYAGGSALINYIFVVPNFWSLVKDSNSGRGNLKGVRKTIRLLVIPGLILLLFIILYNLANTIFSEIINDAYLAFTKFFAQFFDWFSWNRGWFLLLGLFITSGLLLKSNINYFSDEDKRQQTELKRKKNDLLLWKKSYWFAMLSMLMGRFANGIMALRNENKTGIISLLSLNGLLFLINVIDIIYVWFGFTYSNNVNLSKYVHEGAGLLIFSIVLAMLLLLFFFRGNLNFYKKNNWLKQAAYWWIIQNALLVVSVFIRDYYYIEHYGLAYKRIGVLVFLLMVLMGLITVFIKIRQQKTNYFLVKANAWFAVILLVAASCIHWDEMIANYNLARKDTIALDVKFLLTLSDKALPLLENNKEVLGLKLITTQDSEGDFLYRGSLNYKEVFERRKMNFFNTQKKYSWLSWNHSDAYTKQQLALTKLSYLINK